MYIKPPEGSYLIAVSSSAHDFGSHEQFLQVTECDAVTMVYSKTSLSLIPLHGHSEKERLVHTIGLAIAPLSESFSAH